jgi:hypothetical protein
MSADRTDAIARYEELAARSRTDHVQPAVLSVTVACAGRLEESASWLLKAFDIRDSLMLALIAQFADLTPVLQRPAVREALRHVNWPLPERH